MLTGVQAAQLAQRRVQLANSEQTIAAYPQKIAAVEALEQALAQRRRGLARPTRPASTGCSAHRSNKGGCRTSRHN